MSSFDLADVHNHAQQIVRAGTLELHALAAVAASNAGSVRKHVELERELDDVVYLGRRPVMPTLFVLESLVLLMMVS